jgi:hypothetical protein
MMATMFAAGHGAETLYALEKERSSPLINTSGAQARAGRVGAAIHLRLKTRDGITAFFELENL